MKCAKCGAELKKWLPLLFCLWPRSTDSFGLQRT